MNSIPNKSKEEKIATFNANWVGNISGNIFGLPFTTEESEVVIIPVPWDVTVSSADGTWKGPENVLQHSPQIDLFDEAVSAPWKAGISMEPIFDEQVKLNKKLRSKASAYIGWLEKNPDTPPPPKMRRIIEKINYESENLCNEIKDKATGYLKQNKLLVLLGGDHSTPLGYLKALAEKHASFGLLQIDAHADLRPKFMGFTHSHASIMYNASSIENIENFVQVGIRDLCEQEVQFINDRPMRFHPFYARDIHYRRLEGETWRSICDDVISKLPQKVYISFDIDGLDPWHCPGTGTPVPGGLQYWEVLYLFERLVDSQRTIIGFDLVETGPGKPDGIVSCRLLYKTIALMLKSQGRI